MSWKRANKETPEEKERHVKRRKLTNKEASEDLRKHTWSVYSQEEVRKGKEMKNKEAEMRVEAKNEEV